MVAAPALWLADFLAWKSLLQEVNQHGFDERVYQEKLVCQASKVVAEKPTTFLTAYGLQQAVEACTSEQEVFQKKVTSATLANLQELTKSLKEVAGGKPKEGKWHQDVKDGSWTACVAAAKQTLLIKSFARILKERQTALAAVRLSRDIERGFVTHLGSPPPNTSHARFPSHPVACKTIA